jgi:septum site-determining protein MinD
MRMARTIAIHSFKGGVGKSTIAANVAVALAMRGRRVGVMDMDLEGPGLHVFFGVDPNQLRFTLNDVLAGVTPIESAAVRMTDKVGLKNGGEIYYAPASVKVSEIMRTIKSGYELEYFSDAIHRFANRFGLHYILIDTHPGIEPSTLLAIGACDHQIIVSRIDQQDVFGTGVMVEVAAELGKPAHLILNMIPPRVKEADVIKFAKTLGSHFAIDSAGWFPWAEEVIGSLSKSILVLKSPKLSITERFRHLAETIEGFN